MSDQKPKCFDNPECKWPPNYRYVESGKNVGMCFGHATVAERESGKYGRRVRVR